MPNETTHLNFFGTPVVKNVTTPDVVGGVTRSGTQRNTYNAGSHTNREARDFAQIGPHPSSITTTGFTTGPNARTFDFTAPNPPPRYRQPSMSWAASGMAIGGALGGMMGYALSRPMSSSEQTNELSSMASMTGSMVGSVVGGALGAMIGWGSSMWRRERYQAGHIRSNAAGGSGTDLNNIFGQNPEVNMGHDGHYPVWRAMENDMNSAMRTSNSLTTYHRLDR